jgi:hypothetical protein
MPGDKKDGPLSASPSGHVIPVCYREVRGNHVADRMPRALALLTACVRLRTPSVRANSSLLARQNPEGLRSCYGLSATVDGEFAIDIACVGLDCVQREEEPGSDLWIGQPFGDEL